MKIDKARQLFQQAKDAYDAGDGDFFFNADISVPAELLFIEMCRLCGIGRNHQYRQEFRSMFNQKLRAMLKQDEQFNENTLGANIKKSLLKNEKEAYIVYFGIHVKRNSQTPLPFGKVFTLNGVTFTTLTRRQFEKAHKSTCLTDFRQKVSENLKVKDGNPSFVLDKYIFIKAKVTAIDDINAINVAMRAFNVISTCATVAQNRSLYNQTYSNTGLSKRSILNPVGIGLVSKPNHQDCDIYWNSNIDAISTQELTFTRNADRLKSYQDYLRIFRAKTPIDKRTQSLLLEYADAFGHSEPHLRQLSFWRCLELTTSKDGTSRSEKEIIGIIGNFYAKSKSWRQQGELIKRVRNDFVHNGITPEGDGTGASEAYLNWTQQYTEKGLSILRWLRDNGIGKKSVDEIEDFFDLYLLSPDKLKLAGRMHRNRNRSQ